MNAGRSKDRWTLETREGVTLIRSKTLAEVPDLVHAFSTRIGPGPVPLDMGDADSTAPEILEARARFLHAAGFGDAPPRLLRQVHGGRIVACEGASEPVEADGILLRAGIDRERTAGVRSADCVPVILAGTGGRLAAAVHAGWRGTAAGIAAGAVEALASLGTRPDQLAAAIGPAIGPCCYRVGEEVLRQVAAACRCDRADLAREGDGSIGLDLSEANRRQLLAAGVEDRRIDIAPWCTCCRADLFYSYRREGAAAGRMMAALSLTV